MNFKALPLTALAMLLVVTACTNRQDEPRQSTATEVATEQDETGEFRSFGADHHGTLFIGYASVSQSQGLRTAARYEGGEGLQFYWTRGDHVWINDPGITPNLRQDSENDIDLRLSQGGDKTAMSAFAFEGTLNNDRYHFRYTGTDNPYGDRVTIRSSQRQDQPNNAMHLGSSGDCGVAVAVKRGQRFSFTLVRQAAYITFTPYNSPGAIEGGKLTQIKVTSPNLALNGTFQLDDDGLKLSTRPRLNRQNRNATLHVGNFAVPRTANASTNASILVIAPGTYRNVTIEYTLYDPETGVRGTITKQIPSITFAAGQHRLLSHDLGVNIYGDKYYTWDAKEEYWYGHKRDQPRLNNGQNNNYPKARYSDPLRWYSTAYFAGGTPVSGVASARNYPNVNEVHWYVEAGDASWDEQTVWSALGHLYKGGVWLRTQQSIRELRGRRAHDLKRETYNFYDFTTTTVFANHSLRVSSTGKPQSARDFFFLPAMGCYYKGRLERVGTEGIYWASSPTHGGIHTAYALSFNKDFVRLHMSERAYGLPSWQAK